MLRLFRGTCEAVKAMHTYRAPLASSSSSAQQRHHAAPSRESIPASARPRTKQNGGSRGPVSHNDEDDEDDDMLPQPEGDGDGGYSYGADGGASIPLVTKHAVEDEGDVVFDGDEELAHHGLNNGDADPSQTEVVPYAHRDLKPGYVCHWGFARTYGLLAPKKCHDCR